MTTQLVKFRQELSVGKPDSQDHLQHYIDLEVEISHSGDQLLGVRLYHEEYPESRTNRHYPLQYPYRVISRGVVGSGDDHTVDMPDDYLLQTFTAATPIEASAKAVEYHLNTAIPKKMSESSRNLLMNDEWYRDAYRDHIVVPISTVILAICLDKNLLELFADASDLYVIPRWHIQMAVGARNQQTSEVFDRGHFIQDIFVTSDRDAYQQINRAYHIRR